MASLPLDLLSSIGEFSIPLSLELPPEEQKGIVRSLTGYEISDPEIAYYYLKTRDLATLLFDPEVYEDLESKLTPEEFDFYLLRSGGLDNLLEYESRNGEVEDQTVITDILLYMVERGNWNDLSQLMTDRGWKLLDKSLNLDRMLFLQNLPRELITDILGFDEEEDKWMMSSILFNLYLTRDLDRFIEYVEQVLTEQQRDKYLPRLISDLNLYFQDRRDIYNNFTYFINTESRRRDLGQLIEIAKTFDPSSKYIFSVFDAPMRTSLYLDRFLRVNHPILLWLGEQYPDLGSNELLAKTLVAEEPSQGMQFFGD